ncbi:DUF1127 domain-containing protein [Gammaproteobacteria bacterium]|nr:DUF1127 domain-containing protein [Gammaproteobacteria bacterium]
MKATYLFGTPASRVDAASRSPSLKNRLVAWHLHRTTVRELSNLNDRELSDIGIERGDIHRVASDLTRFR